MTRIALVSAQAALPLDEDMQPLIAALRALDADVATPCWDDPVVEWSAFDLALLRSTWDYAARIDEFLGWAARCEQRTQLCNPLEVVAWNIDKHYLVRLHHSGVDVVPTVFVEPGESAATALAAFLQGTPGLHVAGRFYVFDEFVVKPSVGAGSRDAARYRRADASRAADHLERLVQRERRGAMLQPYLPSVDLEGETAIMYLGGHPSHAIRKGPLLRLDDGPVAGLFAPEDIRARDPGDDERALAAAAYAALPFASPLYARIDMIRDTRGRPVVLELELTEPSLFLAHAPGSADRLARAVLERVRSPGGSSAHAL